MSGPFCAGTQRILVTGANGFVGRELCGVLKERGYEPIRAVRSLGSLLPDCVAVGNIDGETDWTSVLRGVDAVVHLAARVHVMHKLDAVAEQEFWRTNVAGSERLARQAVAMGVKRLVFVSSIKVNGEATYGAPFNEHGVPHPEDAYGRSKLAAEQGLAAIAAETGLELVIVRPPMIVGPGVKGNLPLLVKALLRGIPLPLACIANRRSLIGVRNLASLLECCIRVSEASGEVFLAADSPAISTPELVRHLSEGLGRKAHLLPLPVTLLRGLGKLTGKQAHIDRLSSDLEIDAGKAHRLLGWRSEESLASALHRTAQHFSEEFSS